MARTRRYMHGRKRRCTPLKSHHWGTAHVEDQEGNIVGVGNREGVQIQGRGVVFDRSSQEQADIDFASLSPSQQRRTIRRGNRQQRKLDRFSRKMNRRSA